MVTEEAGRAGGAGVPGEDLMLPPREQYPAEKGGSNGPEYERTGNERDRNRVTVPAPAPGEARHRGFRGVVPPEQHSGANAKVARRGH